MKIDYNVKVYKTLIESHSGVINDNDLIEINNQLQAYKDIEPLTKNELIEILNYEGRWDQLLKIKTTNSVVYSLGEFVVNYLADNAALDYYDEDIYDVEISRVEIQE